MADWAMLRSRAYGGYAVKPEPMTKSCRTVASLPEYDEYFKQFTAETLTQNCARLPRYVWENP